MTDMLTWLTGWYNWPFLLTIAVGVIFILVDLLLGGISESFGLDADADLDVDMDLDVDAGGPDGVAAQVGSLVLSLTWLGLGKVPISVLVETLLLSFGVTGLLVSAVANDLLGLSAYAFPVSLATAIVVAPLVTKVVGELVASIVPADSTTSRKPGDFLDSVGFASSTLTHSIGQVRLDATEKHPQTTLIARLAPSVPDDLPSETEVLIVGHDTASNIYIVVPNDTH